MAIEIAKPTRYENKGPDSETVRSGVPTELDGIHCVKIFATYVACHDRNRESVEGNPLGYADAEDEYGRLNFHQFHRVPAEDVQDAG